MIKVRIKNTGVIEEVTPNIAHDLIERGIAVLATTPFSREERKREERGATPPVASSNTQETEDKELTGQTYQNRQIRAGR